MSKSSGPPEGPVSLLESVSEPVKTVENTTLPTGPTEQRPSLTRREPDAKTLLEFATANVFRAFGPLAHWGRKRG